MGLISMALTSSIPSLLPLIFYKHNPSLILLNKQTNKKQKNMGCNGDNYQGLWKSIGREFSLDAGSEETLHLNRDTETNKLASKEEEWKRYGSRQRFDPKEQSPERIGIMKRPESSSVQV